MKRLNILCENAKVADARKKAKAIMNEDVLVVPLSKRGKLPATHWFCSLTVTEEGYQKIMEIQEHSVIEEGSPKDFLKKWGLEIIKDGGDLQTPIETNQKSFLKKWEIENAKILPETVEESEDS